MTQKSTPTSAPTPIEKPKALIKAGRGNLGGTCALMVLSEIAIQAGRPLILADGDVRNPGISLFKALYDKHGLPRPESEESGELKRWYTDAFSEALLRKASLAVDIGGGDRTLEEWASEDSLVDAADAMGLPITGLFMCGPQPGDIDYLLKLWGSGLFKPKRGVIVLNEWTVPAGHKPDTVLGPICVDTRLTGIPDMDVAFLRIPKLTCMAEVISSGLSFHDAAAGKAGLSGKPLDPMRRWQVGHWLEKIQTNIVAEGIDEWLP